MRLQPDDKIKVAGKTYAVHGPVFEDIKGFMDRILIECKKVETGEQSEMMAMIHVRGMAARALEDL